MAFAAEENTDRSPLLSRMTSPSGSEASYKSFGISSSPHAVENGSRGRHSLEDNTVPESAVLGRNIGWSSAYILIISRVIGSGIFATPGAIVRSVGSIGITLILWVAGAIISWFGLMVTLEYGCMLPRSGGRNLSRRSTYGA